MRSDNENVKVKFDLLRKDVEIRLEFLKSELEDKAKELNKKLNQNEQSSEINTTGNEYCN